MTISIWWLIPAFLCGGVAGFWLALQLAKLID
jgi:hypothetical protein